MNERHSDENLERLIVLGINWVRQERELQRPQARRLTDSEASALSGHFSREQLERTRLREVDFITIPPELKAFLPGYFVGFTFDDTIVCVGLPGISTKFHEGVHVAQFGIMGLERTVARFVRGGVSTAFVYKDNPLEKQAFDLQLRFMVGERFSVDEEVKKLSL